LPMEVQLVTPDEKIEADKGRVALRYGPMIYNVEAVDQDITKTIGTAPFSVEWHPELLRGVMTIKGKWADGSPLVAVPNYARLNRDVTPTAVPEQPASRNPASIVWIKKE